MIIALAGAAGSGKDTIAELIGLPKLALADPCKRFLHQVFQMDPQFLWGPSPYRAAPLFGYPGWESQRPHTWYEAADRYADIAPRFAAQWAQWTTVPMSQCREHLDSWWSKIWHHRAELTCRYLLTSLANECGRRVSPQIWLAALSEQVHARPNCVITDMRQNNEFEWARACGWELWHIIRSGVQPNGHPSEADLHGPTLRALRTRVIHNSGTLDDLRIIVSKATIARALV